MVMPLAGRRQFGNDNLQLYYPLLTTSPAMPQAGDSYLSNVSIKDISIRGIYMEGGQMEPNLGWDGTKYDWSSGTTEIQTDFVNSGGVGEENHYNLLKNTALSTEQTTYWTEVFEVPYIFGGANPEQTYNWIYSAEAPADLSKIWVDTSQLQIVPQYWDGEKWNDYYSNKANQLKATAQIEDNSWHIFKPKVDGLVGVAQVAKLPYVIWKGESITVGFNFKEAGDSGGVVIRLEMYDSNKQLIQTDFSSRFFNKSDGVKHYSLTGTLSDDKRSCAFIRVSILTVDDRRVDAYISRVKAESGPNDSGWNLHEEELKLDLNAGEIEVPVLDGELDKSKLISEIAILRSVLGEGLLKWEEVTRIKSSSVQEAVLYDYFIENGNYYRYALQPILANGMKGAITSFFDVVTTFDGFWLLGEKDEQFSFIYNGKIGEINHVKPRDMVQTIGGEYPYFVTSSELNYRQYTFSGTLTSHQDVLGILASKHYSTAISPNPTVPVSYVELKYGDESKLNLKNDLEEGQNGMVMQRLWRNKIVKWLNDGKPKILKSEAQGNMLVMLTDIKVTPNETTFGLISDFSCTVTEIGGLDEKALQKYMLRKKSIGKDELVKEARNNSSI